VQRRTAGHCAATAIENRTPEGRQLLQPLAPQAGKATIIGITGPPGAGKSTLVDALARALRAQGRTVGIIAVDPTSRVSGGAILGDRIRMQYHHADPGIFIRSMASRGAVGGLARTTADLALLMDAAGKDYVIIETVGVGQDELEIAGVAQITIVVLVPAWATIQAIKAGILEIADISWSKADHPGADAVEREIHANWPVPIVRTVAMKARASGVAGRNRKRSPNTHNPRWRNIQLTIWDRGQVHRPGSELTRASLGCASTIAKR
jgi:LAO/AO transport system kinase